MEAVISFLGPSHFCRTWHVDREFLCTRHQPVRSVVVEEMLHMVLAANVLNGAFVCFALRHSVSRLRLLTWFAALAALTSLRCPAMRLAAARPKFCRLVISASENIGVEAPVKAFIELLIARPFESITPAKIVDAADNVELVLFDGAVSDVVAPEPGP